MTHTIMKGNHVLRNPEKLEQMILILYALKNLHLPYIFSVHHNKEPEFKHVPGV